MVKGAPVSYGLEWSNSYQLVKLYGDCAFPGLYQEPQTLTIEALPRLEF